MVELGRLDGGVSAGSSAAGDLSWRPTVSPSMTLTIGGEQMVYSAIAVVYNDGSHWWADLMCHRHFKRVDKQPKGLASYRYDGLEAEGMLRFTGYNLTLTSDSRHISLVLYRKGPPIGSASLESPPPSIAAPAAAASADAEQSTFRDARSNWGAAASRSRLAAAGVAAASRARDQAEQEAAKEGEKRRLALEQARR